MASLQLFKSRYLVPLGVVLVDRLEVMQDLTAPVI